MRPVAINQIKLGGILSYVSLGVSNVLAILYTPFMLRMMGQSEYGLYALVLSIVSYLALMDFGFGATIVRYIALFKSKNQTEKLPSLYGMFISLYSIIGLLCFVIGMVLYFKTDAFFGATFNAVELEKARMMILIIVVYLSISFPFSIFGSIIIANEKFVFQKILTIIKALLTPMLMIPLLLMGYRSVAMIVVAVVIGILIIVSNVWFCFYKIKIKIAFTNFDFPLLKQIFWFSLFVFIKMVLERVYWSSGQFILGATIGTVSVAIFSIALQMKGYYESFSQAISGLFLPRVTSMVANNDSSLQISEIFVKVGRIQFHIIGYILCVYVLIGQQFIVFWAGKNYESAFDMSLFIMVPYTIPLIQSIGYSLVQAYNVQKPLILIFLVTTILTIVISFLLIDKFGAKGCAIALSIAIIVGEILLMNWFYYKQLGINIPLFWKEISKIAIPMIAISVLFHFFKSLQAGNTLYYLLLNLIVFSSIYMPFIYWVGMNSYEKQLIFSIFKKNKINKI